MLKLDARALLVAVGVSLASFPAQSCDPSARVFFVRPYNRATVVAPVRMVFGSELVEVKAVPAGEPGGNTGHYDLLINLPGVPVGVQVPSDKQHLRFDKGETEAQVDLPPGTYTLTLQFADGENRSHGMEMSATINLTVLDRLPSRSSSGDLVLFSGSSG
jgi:hypothetical protein